MKIFNKVLIVSLGMFFCCISTGMCQSSKVPWNQRHFPNVPCISAKQAMELKLTHKKVVIIDVPWTTEGFNEAHICGAIASSTKAKKLDRLIKKIPKDFIILAYCK